MLESVGQDSSPHCLPFTIIMSSDPSIHMTQALPQCMRNAWPISRRTRLWNGRAVAGLLLSPPSHGTCTQVA